MSETWVQVVIAVAALLVALGVIVKAVRFAAKIVATGEAVVEVFGDNPTALKVLLDISAQFRTDGGSSLRDVINRLEVAATHNAAVNQSLMHLVDRLTEKVDAGAASAKVVASDLAASHDRADAVEGVAGEAADAASRSQGGGDETP